MRETLSLLRFFCDPGIYTSVKRNTPAHYNILMMIIVICNNGIRFKKKYVINTKRMHFMITALYSEHLRLTSLMLCNPAPRS